MSFTATTCPQPDGLGELVATKETDEDGEILFTGLEPGDYMLKEQVPADFVQGTQLQKITVVKGETDETYTGDNYIVNYPNKGRSPLPNSWATAKLR